MGFVPFVARADRLSWVTRRALRLAGAFALFVLAFAGGWAATAVAVPLPGASVVSHVSPADSGGISLTDAGGVSLADPGGIEVVPMRPGSGGATTGARIDLVPAAGDTAFTDADHVAHDLITGLAGSGPIVAVAALLLATAILRRTPAGLAAPGTRGCRAPPCPA